MSDRVVIDGDMTLTSTIDGEGGAYVRFGQNPVIEPLNVTENGTYEVPEGVEGYSPVTVDVPLPSAVVEPLNVIENGVYTVPDGVDGFNPVTVEVDTGITLLASINPQVGQKNCKIDLDNAWLSKYRYFVIVCDIRFTPSSATEWVYYTCNSQGRPSGRYYGVPETLKKAGRIQGVVTAMVDDNKILLPTTNSAFGYNEYTMLSSGNYLNIGLYNHDYSEGTIIKLYGIV